MSNVNFLLGVGAQKAGTTWVNQYLRRHPQTACGRIKELHVFSNALRPDRFADGRAKKIQRVRNYLDDQMQALGADGGVENPEHLLAELDHLAMELDLARYWEYFRRLTADRPDAVLTGEITPAYSGLAAEQFEVIADGMRAHGFRPRVVFLMRDPVDRCYSMLKMGERNRAKEKGVAAPQTAHENFAQAAVQPWNAIRTRYDETIRGLEEVFSADDIFYGFYETFFSESEVARLCEFLGIDFVKPNLHKKANASPASAYPSPDDIAAVREFYDATYRFCMDRFGETFIRSVWKHA